MKTFTQILTLTVLCVTCSIATAQNVEASAPSQRWEIKLSDVTLAQTFRRWAQESGYRIKWDASKNVVIGAPDVYELEFEEAIEAALSTPGIQNSEYPLDVCFYPNQPPLVRITRRGMQDKECY